MTTASLEWRGLPHRRLPRIAVPPVENGPCRPTDTITATRRIVEAEADRRGRPTPPSEVRLDGNASSVLAASVLTLSSLDLLSTPSAGSNYSSPPPSSERSRGDQGEDRRERLGVEEGYPGTMAGPDPDIGAELPAPSGTADEARTLPTAQVSPRPPQRRRWGVKKILRCCRPPSAASSSPSLPAYRGPSGRPTRPDRGLLALAASRVDAPTSVTTSLKRTARVPRSDLSRRGRTSSGPVVSRAAGSLLSDSHPSGEEHVAYHAIDLMQVTRRLDALEERTEEASTRRTTWRTMELADTISPPPLVDVPPNAMDDYSGILDDFSDVGSGNTEFVEWLDESLRRSGFVDIVYRDPFLAAPTSRAIPSFAPVPSESHWASDPRPEEEVWPVAPEANPPGVGNVHSVETLYDSPMTVSHGSDQDPSPPRDSHPYLLIGAIRPTPARSPALSLRRTSHVIIAPVSGIISQSAAAETMPKASPALLAPQPPGPASRRRRDGLTLTDVDPDAPRLSLASSSASEQGEAREEWRRRQALWARAVATRQKREREQVLRRRAEMGWNL